MYLYCRHNFEFMFSRFIYSPINLYSIWCALGMFIIILIWNVSMTRMNIFINSNRLNLIVIQYHVVKKLNLHLSPGRLSSYQP